MSKFRMCVARCCCGECSGALNFTDDFGSDDGNWNNVVGAGGGPVITGGVMEIRAIASSTTFDDATFEHSIERETASEVYIEADLDVKSGSGASISFKWNHNEGSGLVLIGQLLWVPSTGLLQISTTNDGIITHGTTSLTGDIAKIRLSNRTLISGPDYEWDVDFYWGGALLGSGTYTEDNEALCGCLVTCTGNITTGSTRTFTVDDFELSAS